jgi:hypothetical protein
LVVFGQTPFFMDRLTSLVHYLRQFYLIQGFTIFVRYLIGSAFIIAAFAMGKIQGGGVDLVGSQSLPMCELQPMQQFFKVIADSGIYWQFIGWTQVLAGVLLLTQKWARVGAIIFFGLILNIFVITVAYEFTGTPWVAGLMLLATVYLLIWDIDSLKYLLISPNMQHFTPSKPLPISDHKVWIYLGGILAVTLLWSLTQTFPLWIKFTGVFLLGLCFLVAFFWLVRRENRRKKHGNTPVFFQ